jgi:hypothetical protein
VAQSQGIAVIERLGAAVAPNGCRLGPPSRHGSFRGKLAIKSMAYGRDVPGAVYNMLVGGCCVFAPDGVVVDDPLMCLNQFSLETVLSGRFF